MASSIVGNYHNRYLAQNDAVIKFDFSFKSQYFSSLLAWRAIYNWRRSSFLFMVKSDAPF